MTDSSNAPTPLAEGGDPNDFTNDQVNDYLATLDPDGDERMRVLAAEENGQARVGILGKLDPATTEAAASAGGETVAVKLRQHWTDDGGTNHTPGETVHVDPQTADTLTNSTWGTKD